jgi:hypothetical protein
MTTLSPKAGANCDFRGENEIPMSSGAKGVFRVAMQRVLSCFVVLGAGISCGDGWWCDGAVRLERFSRSIAFRVHVGLC